MIKIILAVVVMIGLSACTQTVQPTLTKSVDKKQVMKQKTMKKSMKMKMFQTVDPKDAVLVQKGEGKNSCIICGMNLTKFYKTSHIATYGDKEVQYCSIHCLEDHLNSGAEVKNPQVVDVTSLKFIPVLEAYYVVGSDVKGTMSRVSKYAFSSLEDAKTFQKKHGGEIMDFRAALEKAKEDF